MSFEECCPHSALESLRAELARETAACDQWREQALTQTRQIARLEQKIERLKFVRDENARRAAERIAQLEQQSSRLRCVVELIDAAQDLATGGTAEDLCAGIAYAVDGLRAREAAFSIPVPTSVRTPSGGTP